MSKREEAREKLMRRAAKEIKDENRLNEALRFIVEEFNKTEDNKPIPARKIESAYVKKFPVSVDDVISDFINAEKKRKQANEKAKERREAKNKKTEEAQTNE